jgi:hypothetical protein
VEDVMEHLARLYRDMAAARATEAGGVEDVSARIGRLADRYRELNMDSGTETEAGRVEDVYQTAEARIAYLADI